MPRKKTTKTADQAATTEQAAESTKSKAAKTKPAKPRKSKATGETKIKKLSALDAAAKVLEESAEPLNTQQMIEAMSANGYWTSPGGRTPDATLYSAISREIKTKGKDSRFKKTDRGLFTRA